MYFSIMKKEGTYTMVFHVDHVIYTYKHNTGIRHIMTPTESPTKIYPTVLENNNKKKLKKQRTFRNSLNYIYLPFTLPLCWNTIKDMLCRAMGTPLHITYTYIR